MANLIFRSDNPVRFFRQGERARQKSLFAEALALYRRAREASRPPVNRRATDYQAP